MENPLVSRTGREMQRYSEEGHRLVAGCIPVRLVNGIMEILLVTARHGKSKGWIFPKGGWETDETMEQAAARESLEEAGVRGVLEDFARIEFKSKTNMSIAHLFVMHVTEELPAWPEQTERDRKWWGAQEAVSQCKHDWMKDAILACIEKVGVGAMPAVSNRITPPATTKATS